VIAGFMDYTVLSEEILVRLLRTGDDNSFREIYLRYWKRLYAHAYNKLKSRETVEEIIQNLFLKLWQNRESSDIGTLENYLFTSLKYNIINYIERKIVQEKHFRYIRDQETEKAAYFEESLGLKELRAIIEQSLSMMPDKTQTVFRLRKLDNYSVLEIAKYLQISEKAVEYHISKSIRILRSHLKDYAVPVIVLLLKA
jgi:RNA polymerase sigma-70 factor (ECF subfamily)